MQRIKQQLAGKRGTSYQYWLFKGISNFCTDANLCSRYGAYLQSNAARAWSERDSDNVTWNDWAHKTNDPNPDAFEMNGMVGLFQVPNTAGSLFSGNHELQNGASKLSLGIQGDSTANSAAGVQNADTGDASASWTFVPESNGYFEIRNVRSGRAVAGGRFAGRQRSVDTGEERRRHVVAERHRRPEVHPDLATRGG